MPYISQADRLALSDYDTIVTPRSLDELDYVLKRVINRFLSETLHAEHQASDISQVDRPALSNYGTIAVPRSSGELNYVLTRIVNRFLDETQRWGETPHYEDYNAVMGVLTCMQHEIYRRRIAPYEDEKIGENGDVF